MVAGVFALLLDCFWVCCLCCSLFDCLLGCLVSLGICLLMLVSCYCYMLGIGF